MKRLLAIILLPLAGCITAPQSIKQSAALNYQMIEATKEDQITVVKDYDAELNHWVDLAFQTEFEKMEQRIVDEEGNVNLEQYKEEQAKILSQLAQVKNEYQNDKATIISEIINKAEKSKVVAVLLQEYENSTGVAPETLDVLFNNMSDLAKDYIDLKMQEEPKEPSRLDLLIDNYLTTRGLK